MEYITTTTSLPAVGSGVDRSPGLHLSDIIQDLGIKSGIIKLPQGEMGENHITNFREMGFTFERILENAFKDRLGVRPGEVELDGIAGSPDGIGVYGDEMVLEEYKCTWKSMKRAMPWEMWNWMTQVKAYCKMIGVRTVVFRVLYVCGTYSPPFPEYREFVIRFTQTEVDENWEMLLNHAKAAGMLPQQ